MLYILICSAVSYILGSISTAVIISKTVYGKDIRNSGSGNAGATNALRVFGKKAGAAVFLFDFFKGMLAVLSAKMFIYFFDAPYLCVLASGFFVQLGHIFPIFFGFKGGKGVATAAGSAMAVMPLTASLLLALFAVTVVITKTVSLASGICAAVYPLIAYFLSDNYKTAHLIFAACCSALIIIKHSKNFALLLDGKENKISFRKKNE